MIILWDWNYIFCLKMIKSKRLQMYKVCLKSIKTVSLSFNTYQHIFLWSKPFWKSSFMMWTSIVVFLLMFSTSSNLTLKITFQFRKQKSQSAQSNQPRWGYKSQWLSGGMLSITIIVFRNGIVDLQIWNEVVYISLHANAHVHTLFVSHRNIWYLITVQTFDYYHQMKNNFLKIMAIEHSQCK